MFKNTPINPENSAASQDSESLKSIEQFKNFQFSGEWEYLQEAFDALSKTLDINNEFDRLMIAVEFVDYESNNDQDIRQDFFFQELLKILKKNPSLLTKSHPKVVTALCNILERGVFKVFLALIDEGVVFNLSETEKINFISCLLDNVDDYPSSNDKISVKETVDRTISWLSKELSINAPNTIQLGVTLPWKLASCEKWPALKNLITLINKYPNPNIDFNLNAKPTHKDHPDKGITLAWYLAVHNQRDLLKQLIDRDRSQIIDLNVRPIHDNHISKGMTLAAGLAASNQWDLLEQFIDRNPNQIINLNAAPTHDNHPHKGVTLAWSLAYHGKWRLLSKINSRQIKNAPQSTILNFATPECLASKSSFPSLVQLFEKKTQSLIDSNVSNNSVDELEQLFDSYPLENIQSLYDKDNLPPTFLSLIKIVLIKKLNQQLSAEDIHQFSLLPPAAQEERLENINNIFILLNSIEDKPPYYSKANDIKSDILQRFFGFKELCEKIIMLKAFESEHNPGLASQLDAVHFLKKLQMQAIFESGDKKKFDNYITEILIKQQKETESNTRGSQKRAQSQIETDTPTTSSNKKPKTDPESNQRSVQTSFFARKNPQEPQTPLSVTTHAEEERGASPLAASPSHKQLPHIR